MTDFFVTLFRNKRDGLVLVDDYNGVLFDLQPGAEKELKSTSPRTLYSRFSEVIFKKGDVIDLKENRDWKNPYSDFWCLELINEAGASSESIQFTPPREAGEVVGLSPNGYITAFKGFPRIVPVDLHCSLVKYSRIEWKMVTERVPMEDTPGYWETKTTLKKILVDRPASELRKIAKEREKYELDRIKAEEAAAKAKSDKELNAEAK